MKPFIDLSSKELFSGSGTGYPTVVTKGTYTQPHDGEGSRPFGDDDAMNRGEGPAVGVVGNLVKRLTRYMGGMILSRYGDFWMATPWGNLLTDGRKLRVTHLVASATFDAYTVQDHDHVLKFDASALAADVCIILPEFGASGLVEYPALTMRGAETDPPHVRQAWGKELYIQAEALNTKDVVVVKGVRLPTSLYEWHPSTVTGEWYLTGPGGVDPDLATGVLCKNDLKLTSGTVGSLTAGTYGYGDGDTLGFDTFYCHLTTSPALARMAIAYVAAPIATLSIAGTTAHLVAYYNEADKNIQWNLLGLAGPTWHAAV